MELKLLRQLWITPCGGFQDQSFANFRVKNTPLKDANGKGKFKWMLSFLFVDNRKLLVTKSFFEEFNDVFFTAESNSKCPVQWNCWVCTWRHGGHVGGQEQKHFSPLRTKNYFHLNSSGKILLYWPQTWPPCHVVASHEFNQGSAVFADSSGTFFTPWSTKSRF